MNLFIGLRGDDAIMIWDADDPRGGIVLETISEAEDLIAALAATVDRVHAKEAERWIAMRAISEAAADYDLPT